MILLFDRRIDLTTHFEEIMPSRSIVSGTININVLLSFVVGVAIVIFMLGFAIFNPDPTPFSQWVFITVLALAAAGVGAVIPGMLEVQLPYVKAGGALALFLIVFLMKPAIIIGVDKARELVGPKISPSAVVHEYLEKVDNGDVQGAWSALDPESQARYPFDQYKSLVSGAREPLGPVKKRTEIGASKLDSPSGYPRGVYSITTFRTDFQSGVSHRESVAARAVDPKQWRVYEHNIDPNPLSSSSAAR
ncbi:DUF4019 domain-containing protein [Microvirga sp. BSC39]|uniref:DUF4019 domain-containing protein n=1 Tax=Microvirga sp. BSC39 TaxID=1549810 RepID=UPI0004E921FA|nr:DUF4019 domain-containing protein [Microvirga sp. BSC39]KFG69577.1 hypothetical protein JH26_09600 [Microvirga sp. BSC39]